MGGTNFGKAHRVRYWSYRPPINIRGADGPGLSIPPTPGNTGLIPNPEVPAEVSPLYPADVSPNLFAELSLVNFIRLFAFKVFNIVRQK